MSSQGTIRRYTLIIERIKPNKNPSFNKLKDYLHEHLVQFRLKFDTKKELFLQRFELSLVFPKISFIQLQSDFKKENDNQINKLKEELDTKQSSEEKPWQKKYRESKLNG